MKQRIISGAVLIVLAVVILCYGGYLLAGVSLVLSVIAYRELMKTCKLAGTTVKNKNTSETENSNKDTLPNFVLCFTDLEFIGYLGIICYYAVMIFSKDKVWLLLTLFLVLIAFLALYVFTFPKYEARQIMSGFFCMIYGPIMLTFIYLTRELEFGIYLVWMIVISSWICDTMAYFSGVLLGKHKLAPVLSPKKSVEGAVGGIIGSAVVGALYGFFIVERQLTNMHIGWMFAIIAAIGAAVSQVGDLAASGIKRNEGIKDYGNLIPGHGGIMDRFDSVIFVAPMVYMLSLLLVF